MVVALRRANYMHSDAASQGGWWQGSGAAYEPDGNFVPQRAQTAEEAAEEDEEDGLDDQERGAVGVRRGELEDGGGGLAGGGAEHRHHVVREDAGDEDVRGVRL